MTDKNFIYTINLDIVNKKSILFKKNCYNNIVIFILLCNFTLIKYLGKGV